MKPAVEQRTDHPHAFRRRYSGVSDDLIDSGVQIINLQDLVNDIDWIAAKYRNKICVDLDIDRQNVTVFGTPAEIHSLIREEVKKIAPRDAGSWKCL